MYTLVLIRHGESLWNQENRFTGWVDMDLSDKGREEALAAGKTLKSEGFEFDIAYTSMLKRAIRTLWIALDEMDRLWLPVKKSWRLNERHYGGLQGLNKTETALKHGEEQVKIWRRSYDTPPPKMELSNPLHPTKDPRYKDENPAILPSCEALKDTVARFLPYWFEEIVPTIKSGKRVLIVAHGNSLRSLIQHLEQLSEAQIMELNVPTGIPLMYKLDENLKVIEKKYLGNPEVVKAAIESVANQGKVKK